MVEVAAVVSSIPRWLPPAHLLVRGSASPRGLSRVLLADRIGVAKDGLGKVDWTRDSCVPSPKPIMPLHLSRSPLQDRASMRQD
jgi:hypothetical protein